MEIDARIYLAGCALSGMVQDDSGYKDFAEMYRVAVEHADGMLIALGLKHPEMSKEEAEKIMSEFMDRIDDKDEDEDDEKPQKQKRPRA